MQNQWQVTVGQELVNTDSSSPKLSWFNNMAFPFTLLIVIGVFL